MVNSRAYYRSLDRLDAMRLDLVRHLRSLMARWPNPKDMPQSAAVQYAVDSDVLFEESSRHDERFEYPLANADDVPDDFFAVRPPPSRELVMTDREYEYENLVLAHSTLDFSSGSYDGF